MDKRYLYKDNIIKKIGSGFEGDVYLYNENGRDVALKIFKNPENIDNKELKLVLLKCQKELIKERKLYHRIYDVNKGFIGYTSAYESATPLLEYINKSKNKKEELLSQLQEKYQILNENGIYIGDMTLDNFGVKDGKLKLFDVDNYSVDGLPFDVKSTFQLNYFERCTNLENVDYYCFNMFTLAFITNIIEPCIDDYIIKYGLPKEFNNDECKKIYRDLVKITDDYRRDKFDNGDDVTLLKCIKKGLFK